jgi:hypothetical protein
LAIWCFYGVGLGFFTWSRSIVRRHAGGGGGSPDLVSADFFVCTLLVTIAVSLATGMGALGIFRSRAEARFIIGSPVPAPLAIAYLQTREALAIGARFLLTFVYFVLFFGPRHIGAVAIIADLLLVGAMFAAAAAVVVPRRLLRGPAAIVCAVTGSVGAIASAAPVLRDAVGNLPLALPAPLVSAVLRIVPAVHPGRVLVEPNPVWLLGVIALAAGAIAILASAGRDAYPELYALSIARIDRIERWRARRSGATLAERVSRAPRSTGRPATAFLGAPPGVLILVWKSIVEFRRQKQMAYIAGGAAGWCVVGFAAARLLAADDALFAAVTGAAINIMLVIGISATSSIAAEVRRPLFWLADSFLFERLASLGIAQAWRPVLSLELVALGFAAGGGNGIDLLLMVIGLPALVVLLVGVGFAAFAMFPSAADWRGPVMALRLGAAAVAIIPPFVVFGVGAAITGLAAASLLAAALIALIEACALVGIAAWRLDGRIDRLPT